MCDPLACDLRPPRALAGRARRPPGYGRASRVGLPTALLAVLASTAIGWASARAGVLAGQGFQGPDLERFLKEGRIVDEPQPARLDGEAGRLTLSLDGQFYEVRWLTIDLVPSGLLSADPRRARSDLGDTYRAECAAYELDRLLGLGMVPATIERVISGTRSALAIDVAPALDDAERLVLGIQAPNPEAFTQQRLKVELFDNLIYNSERRPETILVTEDWQIRLVGHTRAFRLTATLNNPDGLTRFSTSLLAAAQRLDEPTLRRKLDRFVSIWQIRALLERRDRIVALARAMAATHGSTAVYYR